MADEVINPQELAYSIAVETSERENAVGDFVSATDLGSDVTDFRFVCNMPGYEGWQWSVTLYHDADVDRWTVNESTLAPTEDSLLPPPWIPWKDRLKPTDLSVMDSIGTAEDDERLESGVNPEDLDYKKSKANVSEDSVETECSESEKSPATEQDDETEQNNESKEDNESKESQEDFEEAVETFRLTRKRVMTAEAIAQTAKRWYSGQHGPKSLSTKIADGKACSSCGFMIPLAGSLGNMFGVCANMWSPDDGRVVALDHGCGEHSEIEPPEPSQLWIQSAPAYDDYHIEIAPQAPRDERADVELIEEAIEDSKENRKKHRRLIIEDESDEFSDNSDNSENSDSAEIDSIDRSNNKDNKANEDIESEDFADSTDNSDDVDKSDVSDDADSADYAESGDDSDSADDSGSIDNSEDLNKSSLTNE